MTVTIKNTKAEIFAELEALRKQLNEMEASRQADISIASHQQELDRAAEESDEDEYEDEYVDRRSIPVASRQAQAATRWETMQKAKALAMSSGRSVKC